MHITYDLPVAIDDIIEAKQRLGERNDYWTLSWTGVASARQSGFSCQLNTFRFGIAQDIHPFRRQASRQNRQ